MITIRYSSIDRFHETRKFKTLAGAKAYVVKRVGPHADVGGGYAVSSDGVGKIEVDGSNLREVLGLPEREFWWALVDVGRRDQYELMGGPYMDVAAAHEAFFAWTAEDRAAYGLRIAKYENEFDFVGYVTPDAMSPPPPPFAVVERAPAYCQITDAAIGSHSRVVARFSDEASAVADVAAHYAAMGDHYDEVDYEVQEWKPPVPTIAGPQAGYYHRRPVTAVWTASDDDMPF